MEGFLEDKVKSALDIPEGVRVVALLGIGRGKETHKPSAGCLEMGMVCFAEKWGQSIKL